LGRGALTGKLDKATLTRDGDLRQFLPRFSDANFDANMAQTQLLIDLAMQKGISPAQAALGWLLARGEDIVPIPGTRHEKFLNENIRSIDVVLSAEEISSLDAAFAMAIVRGDRYPEEGMAGVNK
jgi:aryl-alcohol dehydrogenase-like predicted oxidoreductase